MTDNIALTSSEKLSIMLVDFRYGDKRAPHYKRYTDSPTPYILPDGELYESRPSMDISLGKRSVTLEEGDCEIKMSIEENGVIDSFLNRLTNGDPHSEVKVRVHELVKTLGYQSKLTQFVGKIGWTTRNAGSHRNRILLRCYTWKSELDIALGMSVGTRCNWNFGDQNCQFDVESRKEDGTITSIVGNRVVIDGISTSHTGEYWNKGYVEQDGLRIGIKTWRSGTTFVLNQIPPEDWLNTAVRVAPGCDKTYRVCLHRWNNNSRFQAMGKRQPPHHPVFEGGGQ